MTSPAPTYDLVLLLDAQAEQELRAKVLTDARAMIAEQGQLVREDGWGDRALAYPIDHKTDAEYHLLQFHVSTPELLSRLDRALRISDGIVRFRIVKLKPGTPDAPDMSSGRRPETEATPVAPTPAAAAAEPTSSTAEPAAAPEPADAPEPVAPEPAATAEPAATSEPADAPEPAAGAAPEAAAEATPDPVSEPA